jgi:hypothetical protein
VAILAKKITINKAFVEKFVAENGYPELGHFTEKSDLQKFYKHLTDAQLAEWIELEGIEFVPAESAPINRMRMCMAVLYLHHPKAPSAKKKSKYADFSLEDLMELAVKHDVIFEITDDERILRMRAIMALRVAGHIA